MDIIIVLNGWTDVSKIDFVAVILKFTANDEENWFEYIGNLVVKERHDAPSLSTALIDVLNPLINTDRILAIVSDSANVMVAMKNNGIKAFPQVYSVPCVLHVLNLVTHDFLQSTQVKSTARDAIELASFLNRSYFYSDVNGENLFPNPLVWVLWYVNEHLKIWERVCTALWYQYRRWKSER